MSDHIADAGKKIAAEPQGEPVAEVVWHDPRLEVFPDREPHKIIDASYAFLCEASIGTKLYAHPDPRIAELESLLREALIHVGFSVVRGYPRDLYERIEAALKGE